MVRAAGKGDLPALLGLYSQLHPEDVPLTLVEAEQIFEQFRRYPGSALLLGFADGAAVTTCSLVVIPNLTRGGAPYALIENVVTDECARNRGFGKAILKEAIVAAWERRCYKVMLLTGSKDPATLQFYRSAGFRTGKTGFLIRRSEVG